VTEGISPTRLRVLFALFATATLLLPASAWLILNVSLIGSILGVAGAIRQRVALLLIFTWIQLAAIRLMRPGLGSSPG